MTFEDIIKKNSKLTDVSKSSKYLLILSSRRTSKTPLLYLSRYGKLSLTKR